MQFTACVAALWMSPVDLSLLILLFEIKRSRKVRDQVSKEAATHSNALKCQKLRNRERCVGWRIDVIQDPVLRHVWTNAHDASPQSLKKKLYSNSD
jgi:hypothetical protein